MYELYIYNFELIIHFWLHWVFIAALRFSLVVASGGHSMLQRVGSRCGGFSCCRVLALGMWTQ